MERKKRSKDGGREKFGVGFPLFIYLFLSSRNLANVQVRFELI